MSTVVSRTFRSSPYSDAADTWDAIVAMLTQDRPSDARTKLVAVTGVAASLIADQVPRQSPIVVTCDGPRTRVYCVYDEDAVEGSDGNEEALSFDALKGDWHISLPCHEDNLSWVQRALKQYGKITARNPDTIVTTDSNAASLPSPILDPKGFLGT